MIQIAVALFVFFACSPFAFAAPLHDAARDGDLEKARALIDEGAVIDAQSDRGETPLILAILAGKSESSSFSSRRAPRSTDAMSAASRLCTRRPMPAMLRSPSC